MGLDTVELVMEIEDAFDVRIPDAEAEKMRSIGDTIDWLMQVLGNRGMPQGGDECPERREFRRLRDELRRSGSRGRFRPSARIAQVVSSPSAIRAWPGVLKRLKIPEDHRRPQRDHVRGFIGAFGPVAHCDSTLADLSRRLAARTSPRALWVGGRLSRARVRALVFDIVAEQMGISAGPLREQTRYIEDLEMG